MRTGKPGARLGFTHVDGRTPIPDENVFLELGFRKTGGLWFYYCGIGPSPHNVSFNLEIDPDTGAWGELVLDDDFGQPYYYNCQRPETRNQYITEIDHIVERFNRHGLTVSVNHNLYGTPRKEDL